MPYLLRTFCQHLLARSYTPWRKPNEQLDCCIANLVWKIQVMIALTLSWSRGAFDVAAAEL